MLRLSDQKIKNVVFQRISRRMPIKNENVAVGNTYTAFQDEFGQ